MKDKYLTIKTLTLTAAFLFSTLFISCENPWMVEILKPLRPRNEQESGDIPAANEDPINAEPSGGGDTPATGGGGSNDNPSGGNTPATGFNNPTIDDFDIIGTGTFMYNGGAKTVTVRAKENTTTGNITVMYNGSTTPPVEPGEYAVTFDVAADTNYTAVNSLNAGTLSIIEAVFDSISDFAALLSTQPANTANNPYIVELNVSDLGGSYSNTGSAGNTIYNNSTKYISLDLSNSTITNIMNWGFAYCTNLVSIIIPNSVTSIEESTFNSCTSLASVTIPNSVISIGIYAFYGCTSLTGVTIPNSVTSIGNSAFWGCTSLASVTIGSGVTDIGYDVFIYCSSLTSINVDSANTEYSSQDGVLYNKNKTTLVAYPGGKKGSFTIPDSVTTIGNGAFWDCTSLASITIPDSVTSIERYAFYSCRSLTSITIPNSVTSIEEYAFYNCENLTSVTFQWSITSSGFNSSAFYQLGDLRAKFYASNTTNGTPGTYTTTAPVGYSSVWTKID